jgi:anaerobic magnesium-protoporphyrin IX monomethyl ester cyclase
MGKIALINPASFCVDDDRLEPPLGLLYLAGAMRARGHGEVELCDLTGSKTEAAFLENLRTIPAAQVYGITSYCTNHDSAKQTVAWIRKQVADAYVVMGGPNPSALPALTLAETGADAVVVGEGEDAFVQCVESSFAGTPIRGVVRGIPRQDIDSYAFPARDLAAQDYSRKLNGSPTFSLLSSRGCPIRCIFCNSVVMGGGAPRVRFRSPENLAQEIQSLRGTCQNFKFSDDSFTANPRLLALLDRIASLEIRFRIFACLDTLTPEVCRALRRAGCVHVAVGLESLDPENLRIIGKARQIGKARNILAARDAGLVVRAYFMVGLPQDSDHSIDFYFSQAADLGLDEFTIYPLIPYPGTEIARHPERYGYTITNTDFREYVQIGVHRRTCFAMHHQRFGPNDVARWLQQAQDLLQGGGSRPSRESQVAS